MTSSKTSPTIISAPTVDPLVAIWNQAISSSGDITPQILLERMKATGNNEIAEAMLRCLEQKDDSELADVLDARENLIAFLESPNLQKAMSICLNDKRIAPTSEPTLDGFTSVSSNAKRVKFNGVLIPSNRNESEIDDNENEEDDGTWLPESQVPAATTEAKPTAKKAGRPKKQAQEEKKDEPPLMGDSGNDDELKLNDQQALALFTKTIDVFATNTIVQNVFQKQKPIKDRFLTFLTSAEMPTVGALNAHIPTWLTDPTYKNSAFPKNIPAALKPKITNVDNIEKLDLPELLQVALVYLLSQGLVKPDSLPNVLKAVPRLAK